MRAQADLNDFSCSQRQSYKMEEGYSVISARCHQSNVRKQNFGGAVPPSQTKPNETPTRLARLSQCRGCGRRRPARMATAYGSDTPSARDIAVTVTPTSRGRIFARQISSLSHPGKSDGCHALLAASRRRCVFARRASASLLCAATRPRRAAFTSSCLETAACPRGNRTSLRKQAGCRGTPGPSPLFPNPAQTYP